jgi:hypothetical protein
VDVPLPAGGGGHPFASDEELWHGASMSAAVRCAWF